MQFKNVIALTTVVAAASAASNGTATNGTGSSNTTSSPVPTNSEGAAVQHFVNAGVMGAVVAGGMALVL